MLQTNLRRGPRGFQFRSLLVKRI